MLQALALQIVCESLGYYVEIIDYIFPNGYHKSRSEGSGVEHVSIKSKIIKYLYSIQLFRQHRNIKAFVRNYLKLSSRTYSSPIDLKANRPLYDVYITGSDQLWNPRYTFGDTSFFLDFAPYESLKISYAASFGVSQIDLKYIELIRNGLARYDSLSVRENSGREIIESLIFQKAEVVLDPTLLLDANAWSKYAVKPKVNKKYILCYFLNYTFDPFPYVDDLSEYFSRITGYDVIRIARPPQKFINYNTRFEISTSPEEFIGWIQNAELVLTTSFHGTAFAVNFSVPVFSIIENRGTADSRQIDLLKSIGLEDRLLSVHDDFHVVDKIDCDYNFAQNKLKELRLSSLNYLKKALVDEKD